VTHFPSLVPPVNRSMYLFDKNQPTITDWLSTAFPGNKANGPGAVVDAQDDCAFHRPARQLPVTRQQTKDIRIYTTLLSTY